MGPSSLNLLAEKRRGEAYARLRDEQILVQQVNTKAEGHPIEVPQGERDFQSQRITGANL
jgi:hypothetical protein